MDPHDSSEAFSLVAWRKSVLYILLFLGVCIIGMDIFAVRQEVRGCREVSNYKIVSL